MICVGRHERVTTRRSMEKLELSPRRQAPLPACVEPLERRELLAATAELTRKGRLTITGDDLGTAVRVELVNGRRDLQVSFTDANNPSPVIVDPRKQGGSPTSVRRRRVRRINVTMGAGDDTVSIGNRDDPATPRFEQNRLFIRCTISGGPGNDVLQGGALDDILIGGPGDDTLVGDRRDDLVFGGTGNDTIFGEGGRDNLFGQDGDDRIFGGGNEDHLYGMAGADTLDGGVDDDFLNAAPGPGDVGSEGEKPDAGEREDVNGYVEKLIQLAVPERFRAAARS